MLCKQVDMALTHCAVQISKPPASASSECWNFRLVPLSPLNPGFPTQATSYLVAIWYPFGFLSGSFLCVGLCCKAFVCVGSGDPAQGLVTFRMYSTTELYSESVLWFVVFSLWMSVVVYIFYGSCSMKRCQVAWGAGVCAVWCELFLLCDGRVSLDLGAAAL